jgi:hypothetical protein
MSDELQQALKKTKPTYDQAQFYLHFWPKLLYIFLSVSVSPLSRMVPFGKIYSLVLSPSKFPIKPVTSPLNSSGTVAERVGRKKKE